MGCCRKTSTNSRVVGRQSSSRTSGQARGEAIDAACSGQYSCYSTVQCVGVSCRLHSVRVSCVCVCRVSGLSTSPVVSHK